MRQEIGDRAGEANTWHNLATIDLREAKYAEARAGFAKALAMRQEIGDRAGEAATWHQLGFVAWESDKKSGGVYLVAIGFLINQAIGHCNTEMAQKILLWMCEELGYQLEQVLELLKSTQASHQQDRGKRLLADAFGGDQ